MSKEVAKVNVSFRKDGQAIFDISTQRDSQLLTALLGIEGYISAHLGLTSEEIREILDEMKTGVNVLPIQMRN